MNQQVKDLGKSFSDTDSFANTFLKRINIAGHIYAGFQVINNTLGDITRRGIEVNKELQKLTNSLTMASAVMISNNDIYGNAISVQDKYRIAQIEASKATELLQKANINTPHSMKETVQIYDAMYFGMRKVGATTSDMVEITEKLSIAAGNKIGFDAFLSAMDGISTGTVEANSEMGRFLSSIGLSNEAIKNSSDVVQLFKDKLSGFQVIQDFDTKMSNLSNSTDMFSKNLMKIPFDYLESKIPSVAALFDSWAKSINEINVYLSNASSLSTYDELINKQYQLLGQISEVKNDKFMWDSEQKTKLKELNSELEIVFQKLTNIKKDEDLLKNVVTNVDTSEIDKLVNETLDPYSGKIDEINSKWLSNFNILVKNGKDTTKYVEAWAKALDDVNEKEDDKNKKALEALKKSATEQNKAYLDISKIGMSEYEKALFAITEQTKSWLEAGVKTNDALAAQSKLIDELNNKKVIDTAKEDLSYYERLVQLKSDSYEKEIELANIAYTQKALDIQGLNRPIEDKEKLLDLETQLYNKTLERVGIDNQINGLDEASNSYQDMLEAQIDLLDATNDWNSNLTGTAAALADVASATGKLSKLNLTNLKNEDKLRTEYEKNKLKFYDNEEKLKEIDLKYTKDKATLDEKNISATLLGYSNIAGALSSMYDEGSREAAAFQIAQSALALVEGTRAILTAGTGDPYTAIPRMIAMGAMVSSLLSNIGIAFGMNSDTETHSGIGLVAENTGTGTVLGSNEASESISNSLNILEDFAQPQFQVLSEMNKDVKTIADNISGVARILVNNSDFALGGGFTETSWSKQAISLNNTITKMTMPIASFVDDIISKIPIIGNIAGLSSISGLVNKVLGSVFGKTSVKTTLQDSGYVFNDTLLTTAIDEGIKSQSYQYVKIKKKKKSLFGSSSSTKYKTYYGEGLDDETSNQFSLILGNIYDSVITAGIALDNTKQETEKALENYIVKLGKISLKGKSQGQIQKLLTNIFSAQSDNIAKTAFPLLNEFQQVGEGMFETLTRVATGMEEAGFYIKRLGQEYEDLKYTEIINKQGDVGFEALYQSITKFEEATYPVNNNLLLIVENLDATAEELYSIYVNLDELRDRLIYLGHEAQGLSSDMIMGAGSISELTDAFSSYFDNFLSDDEQLTYNTQQLIEKFNTLNIALPTSKDGFRALLSSIDLTTASGQELYGRIIVLNDAFASVANETAKSIEELNNLSFESFISSVDKANDTFKSLKDTALSFINSFSSSSDLKTNLISYNKKRAEFESYFLSDGTLKDGTDYDKVKSIYTDLSNVSKTLASNDDYLKNSLIDVFSNDINNFDFAQDVMKVKIVDGLGDLLSLNFEQVIELKDLFKNNSISKAELETLGLEKNQLDKILEYINNSSIISNNESLEKDRLSTQTLSYNDYVGQQEQVDIVKLLGVSYNTAKPLIENLQNLGQLDSSKLFSYVSDLVGFKTGSENYDLTTFSQIQSLNPYLSVDVSTILEEIKKQALLNKQLKLNSYAVGSTSIEYDQIAQIHKGEVIVPKNFSDGIREGNLMLGDNSSIVKEIKNLIEISIQGFEQVRKMRKEVELKGVM
ncbi:hypothetical protein [Aliarcobacter butzleri]|uniref:Phage tail tape measure protein domain-containing protein n=1 Tax=Aliarcobacter butzleri L348 TaxID=1447256 RepID=A0A0G9JNE8_9BACT|nr:hypothetical protein [Aliarcobacter butzleri]KLD95808.1 hypothetical protein AA20_13525 [Aliarcobacter butzleri L348]